MHPTGWLAPSQYVVVNSRLKLIRRLIAIYPISAAGVEDVRFHHAKYSWGANFSTVELGKTVIRSEFDCHGIYLHEFNGYETQELRAKYGYKKISDKSADRFESHCSDALALACEVGVGLRVVPGRFIVVDDTYRPVRRSLHYPQFIRGGIRPRFAQGPIARLQKGLLIGTAIGKVGQLCGGTATNLRYYDLTGRRQATTRLAWISRNYRVRMPDHV